MPQTGIQPTDIMLGRGPTCYNNPGNRVLRKLIKEHVVYYQNASLRSEKAALVKFLVSKLEAKGCRFLHKSSTGAWVEAPSHISEKKVGHGLRDARIEAAKIGGYVNALPKNFRPACREPKAPGQVKPVASRGASKKEEMRTKKSVNTKATNSGVGPLCDPSPKKRQNSIKHEVTFPLLSAIHFMQYDLMTDSLPMRERGQQVLDANVPPVPSTLSDLSSEQHECPLTDGLWEDEGSSLIDYKSEECSEHWGSGDHDNSTTNLWPHVSPTSSDSEEQQRLEHRERSFNNNNDTTALPVVSSSQETTHDSHVVGAMCLALDEHADVDEDSLSIDDGIYDPYQPLGSVIDDAQNLCRWFSSLV